MQATLFDEPAALPNGLAFAPEFLSRWQHSVEPTKALRCSITFRTREEGK